MRKRLLGVSLLALLGLIGCSQPQTFSGVRREKGITNCVSLRPSTTELMVIMGLRIIGRCEADNFPPAIKQTPVVAGVKPDYEAIAKLKPDSIVLDDELYSEAEIAKLKATNIEVIELKCNTIDDYRIALYKIANKVGGEIGVSEYLEKVKRQRVAAMGDPFPTPIKMVMLIPDGGGHHMIAGAKSFQADLMRSMGTTPIGPDSTKFESLNPEMLMQLNPDVIMLAGDLKEFQKDTRFASLKAVKEGKIVGMNQDLCLRRGGRVDVCIYEGHKGLALLLKGKQ